MTRYVIGPDVAIRLARDQAVIRGGDQILAPALLRSQVLSLLYQAVRRGEMTRKEAEQQLESYERLGYGRLPICVAKTHLSISHDPKLKGRPTGWRLPVREMRVAAGAGFIYPICGDMRTMPGLPSRPGGEGVDIDAEGNVVGLF